MDYPESIGLSVLCLCLHAPHDQSICDRSIARILGFDWTLAPRKDGMNVVGSTWSRVVAARAVSRGIDIKKE